MLCLSRKIGEGISIGENITVRVLKKKGGGLMLGIEAPREIPVRRFRERKRRDGERRGAT